MVAKKILQNDVFVRVVLFFVIYFTFAFIQPIVLTPVNIVSMINDSIYNGVAALGMMVIMVTGNFDLSSTSIAMSAALITIQLYTLLGYAGDFFTMFLIASIVGAALAMVNGFLSQAFNLSGFVVSIGTNLIFSSVYFIFIRPTIKTIDLPQNILLVRTMHIISIRSDDGPDANMNIGIIVLVGTAMMLWFLMNKTQLGRGIYALGGDPIALERVGYSPMMIKLLAYAVFGFCSGIAGIYFFSNSGQFEPNLIVAKGADVIASAIFGGCNMREGKGSVGGIMAGVAVITVIRSNLILVGVPPYFVTFAVGMIILLGVLFSTLSERRLQKSFGR